MYLSKVVTSLIHWMLLIFSLMVSLNYLESFSINCNFASSNLIYVQLLHINTNSIFIIDYAGKDFHELHSLRIKTRNTHGTGCSLASCIAAELAKGFSMLPAVKVST